MQQAKTTILVIAAPEDDERARSLMAAFQEQGYQTILGRGAESALASGGFAACVVLLRPATAGHPGVYYALAARPPRLIMLLLEPTPVPPYVWGAPAVAAQESDTATAAQIAGLIPSLPAPITSPPLPGLSAPFGSPPFAPPFGPPPFAPPAKPAAAIRWPLIAGTGGIVAAILVLIIVLATIGPRLGTSAHTTSGVAATATGIATSTVAPTSVGTYSTNTPGPACDAGSARWLQTTNITVTCQANGTLLTQNAPHNLLTGVGFIPAGDALPVSYQVSMAATFVTYDPGTVAAIIVHRQLPYGGQIFQVQSNGYWNAFQDDTKNVPGPNLATGHASFSGTTITLSVIVNGSIIQGFVDDQQVMSITSTTYTTTAVIDLSVADLSKPTTPVSLRLTQFQYTPNP